MEFTVLRCVDAELDDQVYLRLVDRHGDEFEIDMSVETALALAHDLAGAVLEEDTDEGEQGC